MAQSTNDVIPTAGKLTVLDLLKPLDKSLSLLTEALYDKAEEFDPIVKSDVHSWKMPCQCVWVRHSILMLP